MPGTRCDRSPRTRNESTRASSPGHTGFTRFVDGECDLAHMRCTTATLTMLHVPCPRTSTMETEMAAVARMLSRASGTQVSVETLETTAMFGAVGLTVSLLFASYGLDLSAG
jgi:hypothetical protein